MRALALALALVGACRRDGAAPAPATTTAAAARDAAPACDVEVVPGQRIDVATLPHGGLLTTEVLEGRTYCVAGRVLTARSRRADVDRAYPGERWETREDGRLVRLRSAPRGLGFDFGVETGRLVYISVFAADTAHGD